MTADPSRRSPLRDAHGARDARFTDFGGWEMPVTFSGIRTEHHAVRNAVGAFDVSHMGEIEVAGPEAEALMQRLTSNDVTALADGDVQYSAITDEDGVLLDDTMVYRRRQDSYLFVPNAGNDVAMADRWIAHRDQWGLDASVENATDEYGMLAVQGPDAPGLVDAESPADLDGLDRFEFTGAAVADVECLVSRTGYTGEDGFEIVTPWDDTRAVWDALLADCTPCGLGARDTLRTEMGYLLAGQDFHPSENPRTPLEADIGFAVDLDTEFVGRDALIRLRDAGGPDETLVGFVLDDRGVPRHGYPILNTEGDPVGEVTSGTMSPTLEVPIGLGYLPVSLAEPGAAIQIEIREEAKAATVRTTPFVDTDT